MPTFGPMLTCEMSNEIEYIQKRASKLIFGWDTSYKNLIEEGKMELLSDRRERLILNFAKKSESNPCFKPWFPEKNYAGPVSYTHLTLPTIYSV